MRPGEIVTKYENPEAVFIPFSNFYLRKIKIYTYVIFFKLRNSAPKKHDLVIKYTYGKLCRILATLD